MPTQLVSDEEAYWSEVEEILSALFEAEAYWQAQCEEAGCA